VPFVIETHAWQLLSGSLVGPWAQLSALARACEEVRLPHLPALDCVPERPDDSLLPDDLGEVLWAILAVKGCHESILEQRPKCPVGGPDHLAKHVLFIRYDEGMGQKVTREERKLRPAVSRIVHRALTRLPTGTRLWVVRKIPALEATVQMRANAEHDPAYWEAFYEPSYDPFGFDTNPDEAWKFESTLDVCGAGPFGSALELGCAVGTFTELLAPRCESVLAVDISPTAIERATQRLGHLPNVTCEVRALPADLPSGPFDLIVASDVLYYWPMVDLLRAAPALAGALAPGGALVAVHYAPPMGAILSGDEVHDALAKAVTLRHVYSERKDFGAGRPYRVDRFERG
jgi:SAM-dependent methyltransferase